MSEVKDLVEAWREVEVCGVFLCVLLQCEWVAGWGWGVRI